MYEHNTDINKKMSTRPKTHRCNSTESGKDRHSKGKQESELSTCLQNSEVGSSNAGRSDGNGKVQRKTQPPCKNKDNSASSINGRDSTTKELPGIWSAKNKTAEICQQTASGKDATKTSSSTKVKETTSKYCRRTKTVEQNGFGISPWETDYSNVTKSQPDASCVNNKREHCIVNNGARRRNSKKNEVEFTVNPASNGAEIRRQAYRSNSLSNPNLKHLAAAAKSLKMKQTDISNAANKVNRIIDMIIKSEHTKSNPLFKSMEIMSTGSYYERVKISNPNEFDIMLKIAFESYQTIELTSVDDSGAFYTLAFKGRKPSAMAPYTDDEGNILAKYILNQFRTLVSTVLQQSAGKQASLVRKEQSSPAVTLIIPNGSENISVDLVLALQIRQWPEIASHGMNIDSWLGTKEKQKYRKEPCYMVAKQADPRKRGQNDTWRISFSNIEKDIMMHHGHAKTCCEGKGSKCCRKKCLKLMKYLLEQLKESGNKKMNQFCSYHAKTVLLHTCTDYPKDEDWELGHLDVCFNRYVEAFQKCLKTYSLLNFFIPSHNLFSSDYIDKSSCNYLFKELENQKTQDYPIFLSRIQQTTSTPRQSLDDDAFQGYD